MRDHHIGKFFETLFWIGAFLIFASFFYPRWFVITITVGIVLMIMTTIREGFRLRRAKTLVGVIKKNEPKIIHRLILLVGVIIIFAYLFFKRTLIADFIKQLYDLIEAPPTVTWWLFILIGIIIGLFILFCATKTAEIEYRKILNWARFQPKKKPEQVKKKKVVAKKVFVKMKPGFFAKLFWEEESFWRKIFEPIVKKLSKRRAKKLEAKKDRMEQLRKKKLEALKRKAKGEKLILKEIEKKHALLPRVLIALFIFAITLIFILYKKGKFSIENPLSAGILGLIGGLFLLYILINVYKIRKEKKIKKEKKEKGVLTKIKKEVIAKASKYETDIDKLYKLVNEVGTLTITEVSEGFGVSKEQAEEWGRILESHNLIELNYPAIGELQLCKKKSKITK